MNPEITNPRSSYSLDRTGPREKQRLEAQAPFLDPGTIRHVKALGLLSGWHCAEVGAGAGSIAIWLAERVGRSGRVVATDVDTRFIAHLRRDGLEIRRHDILAGPVEANAFDLVHTRLLLSPLADRAKAMNNLVASLRPGGWLLAEDYDLSTAGSFHPASELQVRLNEAMQTLFRQGGADPRSGDPPHGGSDRGRARGSRGRGSARSRSSGNARRGVPRAQARAISGSAAGAGARDRGRVQPRDRGGADGRRRRGSLSAADGGGVGPPSRSRCVTPILKFRSGGPGVTFRGRRNDPGSRHEHCELGRHSL